MFFILYFKLKVWQRHSEWWNYHWLLKEKILLADNLKNIYITQIIYYKFGGVLKHIWNSHPGSLYLFLKIKTVIITKSWTCMKMFTDVLGRKQQNVELIVLIQDNYETQMTITSNKPLDN